MIRCQSRELYVEKEKKVNRSEDVSAVNYL